MAEVFFNGDLIAAANNSVAFGASSITRTLASGMVVTTTFNADGSITTVYPTPISKTVTTTFNSDGSISETVS